ATGSRRRRATARVPSRPVLAAAAAAHDCFLSSGNAQQDWRSPRTRKQRLLRGLRSLSLSNYLNAGADSGLRANYSPRTAAEKKLIRLPSGSRNSIERLPQGCVVGSRTNLSIKLWSRACSRSISATSKSRIIERFDRAVAAPAL